MHCAPTWEELGAGEGCRSLSSPARPPPAPALDSAQPLPQRPLPPLQPPLDCVLAVGVLAEGPLLKPALLRGGI